MKKFIILAAAAIVTAAASCSQYKYETVKGDPLGTKGRKCTHWTTA